MSDSFNTDGMFGMPVIDDNCLESIERAIAFDVRDWSEDRRSAWVYGIIFGWDKSTEELKEKFNWTNEDVERMSRYHLQWEEIKSKFSKTLDREQG